MAPKLELEKLAWQWTEETLPENVTELHVETAYRLHFKPCKPGCRRNCKGNPHCLEALGEREWLSDLDEASWVDIEDPNSEKKLEDSFVGLKNLGATCYVNSLLQLWYHNPPFRKAIYQYQPDVEGPSTNNTLFSEDEDSELITDYYPRSVIGQLQRIFALLQFSNRRYVDPSMFVKSLGLKTSEQQDAHEFYKLFFALLEDRLQSQPNVKVRNIVHEQFRGDYEYVTQCSKCLNNSTQLSEFYELDLNVKGNKDLYECIEEFLKEEQLEGSDQYFCSNCNSKQNATRKIRLRHLPPVLNFQLLRFHFDRQSSQKKKVNSCIKFPEVLEMAKFLEEQGRKNVFVYDLNAVLVHRGQNAASGHFVALIRDRVSGSWFKFNDENIDKLDGKSLQLGSVEDDEDNTLKPQKSSRLPKGVHSSNNAYMLVYHLRDETAEVAPSDLSVEWDIPEKLQESILKDNSRFEEWIMEMNQMRQLSMQSNKERQHEIKELYPLLMVTVKEEWEWIPTEWLMKWLSFDAHIPKINNNYDLCPHNRLNPDSVINLKCIRKSAASALFEKYGGSVRLGKDSLCRECVIHRCLLMRWKARIQDDHRFIQQMIKCKIPNDEDAFWIGKLSLRHWRKLARRLMPVSSQSPNNSNSASSISNGTNDDRSCQGNNADNEHSEENFEDVEIEKFNEDMVCEHGEMRVQESCRRLVHPEVWSRLKTYFPTAPEFRGDLGICHQCKAQSVEVLQVKDLHRQLALEQKTVLLDLYLDRNRPNLSHRSPLCCYMISREFIERWKRFIKEPTRHDPVINLSNEILLCTHKGLLSPPPDCKVSDDEVADRMILVWEHEWKTIQSFFNVDHEITVTIGESLGCRGEPAVATCKPDVCAPCYEARLQELERRSMQYSNATVYVSQLPEGEDILGHDLIEENPAKDDSDPEFVQGSSSTKKRRLNGRTTDANSSINDSPASSSILRRSTRHRRGRGEKAVAISSHETIRDFKVKLIKDFCAAPFDQHLFLNGVPLENDKSTVAEAGIRPGSLIFLKVDRPTGETITEKVSAPEEGFKGTELLRM